MRTREDRALVLLGTLVLLLGLVRGSLPGLYGFGSQVTGGIAGTRVKVDTLAWVAANDAAFNVADCTDGDTGDCSLTEAICASNRYVEFSVTGDIVKPDSGQGSHATGVGRNALIFEWGRDCPGGTVANVTLDGSTAPGAGVQVIANGLRLAGSAAAPVRNIHIRHMRFRSTGTLFSGCFEIGGGVHGVVLDHVSTAYCGGYAMPISPVFTSELNEPVRALTFQNSLFGLPTTYPAFARSSSLVVDGDVGGCSNAPSTKCCGDAQCSGGGTCTSPAPGAHCFISGGDGVCEGGTRDGLACGDGTDRGCPGGACAATCQGTGTHVGKRAGLGSDNLFQAQGDWAIRRHYDPTNGCLCEGGTRDGLVCNFGETNDCPSGTERNECPLTTDYAVGPYLSVGEHAKGPSIWGDTTNLTFYRVVMGPGNSYRQPNISVDAGVPSAYNVPQWPLDISHFEVVNSIAYGGVLAGQNWVQGRRQVDVVLYNFLHLVNAATRANWKDVLGDTENVHLWASMHAGVGELGGCGDSPDLLPCKVRHYFGGLALDRRRDDPADPLCWAYSYQLTGGANSYLVDGCEATEAERLEKGYAGERQPWNAYPDLSWASNQAMIDSVLASAGATLPCRDAVDDLMIRTIEAGEDIRSTWDAADLGGLQDLSKGCVSAQANTDPTAQSKTVTVGTGSGVSAWSATVSDADDKPLNLYCFVTSPGSAKLAIENRAGCEDGTVEGTVDVTGLGVGSYPATYKVCDGRPADCATGTITVAVE